MDKNIIHLQPGGDNLGSHEQNWQRFEIHQRFSHRELLALREFYAGIPARRIRQKYGDPWPVLARHRALSRDLYEALKWELIRLPACQPEHRPRGVSRHHQPRWRKCRYCEQWTETQNWQSAHLGSSMIGFPRSGCRACFDQKLDRYQQAKGLELKVSVKMAEEMGPEDEDQ